VENKGQTEKSGKSQVTKPLIGKSGKTWRRSYGGAGVI